MGLGGQAAATSRPGGDPTCVRLLEGRCYELLWANGCLVAGGTPGRWAWWRAEDNRRLEGGSGLLQSVSAYGTAAAGVRHTSDQMPFHNRVGVWRPEQTGETIVQAPIGPREGWWFADQCPPALAPDGAAVLMGSGIHADPAVYVASVADGKWRRLTRWFTEGARPRVPRRADGFVVSALSWPLARTAVLQLRFGIGNAGGALAVWIDPEADRFLGALPGEPLPSEITAAGVMVEARETARGSFRVSAVGPGRRRRTVGVVEVAGRDCSAAEMHVVASANAEVAVLYGHWASRDDRWHFGAWSVDGRRRGTRPVWSAPLPIGWVPRADRWPVAISTDGTQVYLADPEDQRRILALPTGALGRANQNPPSSAQEAGYPSTPINNALSADYGSALEAPALAGDGHARNHLTCCWERGASKPKHCATRCCCAYWRTSSGLAGCEQYCLLVHERTHQLRECSNKKDPYTGPTPPSGYLGPGDFDECCAYFRQAECLRNLYARCGFPLLRDMPETAECARLAGYCG